MTTQNNKVLPKGITQADFDKAISEFRTLLGNDNGLTVEAQLKP